MTGTTPTITLLEGPDGGIPGNLMTDSYTPNKVLDEAQLQNIIAAVVSAEADIIAEKILDHIFRDMVVDRMSLTEENKLPGYAVTANVAFNMAAMEDYLKDRRVGLDLSPTSSIKIGDVEVESDFFSTMGECLDSNSECGLDLGWLLPEIMAAIFNSGTSSFRAQIPRYGICYDAME